MTPFLLVCGDVKSFAKLSELKQAMLRGMLWVLVFLYKERDDGTPEVYTILLYSSHCFHEVSEKKKCV